jgi:putative transposase
LNESRRDDRAKHTHVSLRVHCVFSTKGRVRSIPDELQPRLWTFMGGIARRLGIKAIAIGGVEDHLHIPLLLPATMPLAKAVQTLKANSSRWIHEITGRPFEWQEGYAAFSVGISQTAATVAYIRNQREHHAQRGFDEELARVLEKHGLGS